MAANHIPVDQGKRLGQQLRRLIDMQREVLQLNEKLKDIMETQIDTADYTLVATEFGLPSGKGETVYNLVAGMYSAVNVSAVNQAIDWMG